MRQTAKHSLRAFSRGAALALAGLIAGLSPAEPLQAGPLADAAAKAEEKSASGDSKAAFDIMREAFGDFSESLPFTVSLATFVSEKPPAYGAYSARSSAIFKRGEPIVTYLELIGLTWNEVGKEKQQANFTVDLQLADSKGDTLAEQKGFGNFTFTGHVRNQEIFTHLTLDVSGAAAGDYVLRYIVNDVYGGHSAPVELPFTIATQ